MKTNLPPYEQFECEQIYHLYTRSCGSELIFRTESNYCYFLKLISKYLIPYMEIYAYCLVPQRLALLVCFRTEASILKTLNKPETDFTASEMHQFLMQPVSNLLNSYSKAYNKMYQRKGALFTDYIKRAKLDNVEDITAVFDAIHQIPIESKLVEASKNWKFSSYNAYQDPTKLTKVSKDFMLRL